MPKDTTKAVILISATHPSSGRKLVLEDDGRSCWLYLSDAGGAVKKSVLVYSPIPPVAEEHDGARFIGRFTKNREGDEAEAGPWQWTFQTVAGRTTVQHDRMDNLDMFVQLVADGLDSCKDIADEMSVTKGTVSKWAKRAANMKPPRIKINGGRYQPPD